MANEQINSGLGGIILCGGSSKRMGFDKSELTLDGVPVIDRIVNAIVTRADRIVVSTAGERSLELLARKDVEVVHDRFPDRGPLEGIRCGLASLHDQFQLAMVVACDTPLVNERLIDLLLARIDGHEAAVPESGSRLHGLTAIYRTELFAKIDEQLDRGELAVKALLNRLDAAVVSEKEIKTIDPELATLANLNSEKELRAFSERFGVNVDRSRGSGL